LLLSATGRISSETSASIWGSIESLNRAYNMMPTWQIAARHLD